MSRTRRRARPAGGQQQRAPGARTRKSIDRITNRSASDAAGPGEFPGLEAFLAEDRAPLRRSERHRRLLAACGAGRQCLDPFAGRRPAAGRAAGSLALAVLAPFRLVLEVLVGEELLLSRRPDELRAAVDAPEDSV